MKAANWRKHLLAKSPKWLAEFNAPEVAQDLPYLHWQSVSRLTPPANLKPRTWWTLIKLRRSIRQQSVQVSPHCVVQYFIPATLFAALPTLDASLRPTGMLGSAASKRMSHSLTTETIATCQVDGIEVRGTDLEVRSWLWPDSKPKISAHRSAWNTFRVLQWLVNHPSEPLTPSLIADLHERLVAGTSAAAIITPIATKAELTAVCAFANDTGTTGFLHPWIRGVAVQFWFAEATTAPAAARLGRALTYWLAVRNGWPGYAMVSISAAINQSPKRFRRAMKHTTTDDNDLNYLLLDQLDRLTASVAQCETLLACTPARSTSMIDANHDSTRNPRQRELVDRLMKSRRTVVTIREHQHLCGVAYQTARTDLLGLVELGWLQQRQVGKHYEYVLKEDHP